MPIYHRLGSIPHKRHTAFRKEDGSLYPEQLVGNLGFMGPSSLLYHLRIPTSVTSTEVDKDLALQAEEPGALRLRHWRTARLEAGGSPVRDRVPVLFNDDVALWIALPTQQEDAFYRNGQADELIYVSEGQGVLESTFGELPYRKGDYLVIPRGILHRYRMQAGATRLLVIESTGYVRTPERYRNEHGQLLEMSPFCERDMRRPEALPVHDETGEFSLLVKMGHCLHRVALDHHPFDVVGWDGYYYPWALNIEDFEPIVGRVHQPPPVHQSFESEGFVVCNFVPRLFDWHPEAVPAPYNHSNVMADEVLYYASDEFMSRKGIEYGSITLHPDGLSHGPHPGKAEGSIGARETNELAVMLDTYKPLKPAVQAAAIEDREYYLSWVS
jgi:homogentisate 1,2-dioxygenase